MLFVDTIKSQFPELKNIFEIGAHRGDDIKEILSLWPKAHVYAFEADPFNYEICNSKFQNNPNVNVYNLAASDYSEQTFFYRYHPENPVDKIKDEDTFKDTNLQDTGGGSILEPGTFLKMIKHDEIYQKLTIDSISMHDFCLKNNVEPDAIFMDVQGAEFKVLYGCRKYLQNIKAIILEWSTHYTYYNGETDFVVIKTWLEHNGFQEVDRVHQLEISGDSLFLNTNYLNN